MASKIEVHTGITVFTNIVGTAAEFYCEKLCYHINSQVGDNCVIASILKNPKAYELGIMGDVLLDLMKQHDERRMMFMVMCYIDDKEIDDIKQVLSNLQYAAQCMNARPYFFMVSESEKVRKGEHCVDITPYAEDMDTKIVLKV